MYFIPSLMKQCLKLFSHWDLFSSVINESNFTIFTINRDWYLFRISIISLCSLAHFFLYGFLWGRWYVVRARSLQIERMRLIFFLYISFTQSEWSWSFVYLRLSSVSRHSRLVIVCAISYAHDWMLNVNKRKSLLLIMVKQRDPLTSNHCSLTTAFRRRSLT